MKTVLIAILVLGTMGLLFGLVLAVASKVFAVKTDERLAPLTEALPGANCGGCGFSGCGAYAQAVLDGKAKIGLCAAGGQAAADEMAKIMGVEAGESRRMVAMVRCRHKDVQKKGEYQGLKSCLSAMKVAGKGPNLCEYGCIGYGDCAAACKFGAMQVIDGCAIVNADKCTGCMACAAACPKGLILKVPYEADILVACSSRDKGADVRKICDIGCIGCKLCEKNCPNDAIHVVDNLAVIDHTKCNSCGICAEKCPRHLIADMNLRHDEDLVEAKAR